MHCLIKVFGKFLECWYGSVDNAAADAEKLTAVRYEDLSGAPEKKEAEIEVRSKNSSAQRVSSIQSGSSEGTAPGDSGGLSRHSATSQASAVSDYQGRADSPRQPGPGVALPAFTVRQKAQVARATLLGPQRDSHSVAESLRVMQCSSGDDMEAETSTYTTESSASPPPHQAGSRYRVAGFIRQAVAQIRERMVPKTEGASSHDPAQSNRDSQSNTTASSSEISRQATPSDLVLGTSNVPNTAARLRRLSETAKSHVSDICMVILEDQPELAGVVAADGADLSSALGNFDKDKPLPALPPGRSPERLKRAPNMGTKTVRPAQLIVRKPQGRRESGIVAEVAADYSAHLHECFNMDEGPDPKLALDSELALTEKPRADKQWRDMTWIKSLGSKRRKRAKESEAVVSLRTLSLSSISLTAPSQVSGSA